MISWNAIAHELRIIPWPEITRLLVTVLLLWVMWLFTKRYYYKAWLRWAPEKAKDELLQARRELVVQIKLNQRLVTENAELRGRIEGARLRLEQPRRLELVERAQVSKR